MPSGSRTSHGNCPICFGVLTKASIAFYWHIQQIIRISAPTVQALEIRACTLRKEALHNPSEIIKGIVNRDA
jgi:hypothetical protein